MAAKTDIIKIGSHHDEVQVGQLKECVQQLVRDEAKSMFLERCEDRLGILELGQILQAVMEKLHAALPRENETQ